MSAHRPIVIINPRSGGGLKESTWAKLVGPLTEGMGEFDSVFTSGPRDATRLAREAASEGRTLVVALGGDGTVSEVADGILQAGAGATTEIGLIPRGTGGDFRRSLELPSGLREAAKRIREAPARTVDAGRVSFIDHDGAPATRHFINVASFGFSSAVAGRANASSKRFGGKSPSVALPRTRGFANSSRLGPRALPSAGRPGSTARPSPALAGRLARRSAIARPLALGYHRRPLAARNARGVRPPTQLPSYYLWTPPSHDARPPAIAHGHVRRSLRPFPPQGLRAKAMGGASFSR